MRVRIYQPAKTTMQSGRGGRAAKWLLEYETETPRAPEPLMGWTASGDTLNQVRIPFADAEKAIAFAKAKGWEYDLATPNARIVNPRSYADNFRWRKPAE